VTRPDPQSLAAVLAALGRRFGERVKTTAAVRALHARGEGHAAPAPPDAVVAVHDAAEVAAIAALCNEHRVPIIPYGAGTSLEGHVTAPLGGICVDLTGMSRVLRVSVEDLDCTVEPGVTREQLNREIRDRGLFFPIDPGANATLGGMASTRASGTNAVRYGTMLQNVLGLEVVLPDGRTIRTGGRARKSSAGYDLTRLFVGSEGTLGLITQVTLRLYGLPEAITAAVCAFESLEGAVATVVSLIQLGVPVARVEFLDEVQIRACNAYSRLGLPERPTLFLEFHGSVSGVEEQARAAAELAAANGGGEFAWARLPEERTRLWKARHDAYFAAKALRPGCEPLIADVCVPIASLVECVTQARRDIDAAGLIAPILGHVGDGNFHVLFLVDPNDPAEARRVDAVYGRMIDHALAVGGTCTGEHGIGSGKREKLIEECGADAVDVMRSLKTALDPRGIMNPGKIFLA